MGYGTTRGTNLVPGKTQGTKLRGLKYYALNYIKTPETHLKHWRNSGDQNKTPGKLRGLRQIYWYFISENRRTLDLGNKIYLFFL